MGGSQCARALIVTMRSCPGEGEQFVGHNPTKQNHGVSIPVPMFPLLRTSWDGSRMKSIDTNPPAGQSIVQLVCDVMTAISH
jgi:hypothetical protein